MRGLLFSVSLMIACTACGCIGDSWLQQQRDERLLQHETPRRADTTVVEEPGQPPPAMDVPQIPVADRSGNETAPLTLRQALHQSLSSSDVVRVIEGGEVRPSLDTFYDLEAAEQRTKQALAAFDASIEAEFYSTRIRRPPSSFFGPGLSQPGLRDEGAFTLGITKPMITGGSAKINYNPDPGYLFIPDPDPDDFNPRHVGQLEFSVIQPLLQGAGAAVNRAPLQISQLSASQSGWEFKKAAMTSVRDLTTAYWELYAAQVAINAIDEVIPLVEEVVRLQTEAYNAEWLIYADVAKAYAQLHQYRQERVELESAVAEAELRLRHLMGVPAFDGFNLEVATAPTDKPLPVDTQQALRDALANQPDIVRQRLDVRIRELELLVAENGLKPKLDFEALYRMNGLGENLGDALDQLATAGYSDWQLGATFSVPLGRREGLATMRSAQLKLARENALLQQAALSVSHGLGQDLRQLHYSYLIYQEAEKRVQAADQWMAGARLRYQNPNPDAGGVNWLISSLNDYFAALRARTDAVSEAAAAKATYNTAIVQLEERKGTLLNFYGIDFSLDPCRQTDRLAAHTTAPLVLRREHYHETLDAPRPSEHRPAVSANPPSALGRKPSAALAAPIFNPPTVPGEPPAKELPRRFPPVQ